MIVEVEGEKIDVQAFDALRPGDLRGVDLSEDKMAMQRIREAGTGSS